MKKIKRMMKSILLIVREMHNNWLSDFNTMIKNCTLCSNRKTPDIGLMKIGKDNESINNVNIMLIGLSPRVDSDGNFSMKAGKGINIFFNNISFTKGFCFDNIIKCALNNKEITRENLKCLKYLLMEIDFIKPKYIFLIGSYNILTKVKSKNIDLENETIMGIKFFKFKHFSYFLYNNDKTKEEEYYFNLRMKIFELEGLDAF